MLNLHRDGKIVDEHQGEIGKSLREHRQDDNVEVGGIGDLAR